ncbi:Probable protease sohB [Serratia rubidaea]|uniref:Probable protease sohB n=1 Tax=Serratia rubidaea TaxID=61652 RepID=A0A447QEH5_SERRU|nr:Probable protease sohB [Serratia rubidaea]
MDQTRNLPHIASMAFNEPLLLEPAYARVFFCALGKELGVGRVIDSATNTVFDQPQMAEVAAAYGGSRTSVTDHGYDIQDRIAIVPVSGTLVSKSASLRPYSGMTGYNGIVTRLQLAVNNPDVDGILLDMDTPGGMVAGGFDAADMVARLREQKPIWALANDMSCSAGQLLASACSRRLVTQTAKTGSIGVLMAHSNYAGNMEQLGVDVTLIFSGAHKVDGNPWGALPEDVRKSFQKKMDAMRQMFAEKVSAYSGLSVRAVLDTEAAVYTGQESVDVGLSDELVVNTDALQVMREALSRSTTIRSIGGQMSAKNENQPVENVSTVSSDVAVSQPTASAADIDAAVNAAVAAENTRIMGILGCDEAKGREASAQALASTPGMTVENAQRILASMPESAQVRSETSLDRLMAASPEALGPGNSNDNDNDLMNIPV